MKMLRFLPVAALLLASSLAGRAGTEIAGQDPVSAAQAAQGYWVPAPSAPPGYYPPGPDYAGPPPPYYYGPGPGYYGPAYYGPPVGIFFGFGFHHGRR